MSWWATALIAFFASAAGALAGAGAAALFAARQRCRAARAAILTDYLPPLWERVRTATADVRRTAEPHEWTKEISDAFQALNRFAAAASREDLQHVEEVTPPSIKIQEIDFAYAYTANDPDRLTAARAAAAEQLEAWREILRSLIGYNEWLINDLGRRW